MEVKQKIFEILEEYNNRNNNKLRITPDNSASRDFEVYYKGAKVTRYCFEILLDANILEEIPGLKK